MVNDVYGRCGCVILVQALEQEYGCQLCIGPCTTRGEVKTQLVANFVKFGSFVRIFLWL